MKTTSINEPCLNKSANGLTLVEVLISIVVVAVLAMLLLPALAKSRARSSRLGCVSNLKQVGLAFRTWSSDQGDKFPWSVSTNQGGTLEFANTAAVFRHYHAVSNELSSPRVLTCEKDQQRRRASSWDQLTSDSVHLSYFLGLSADETRPQMILSGDRNLTTNGRLASGLVPIRSNTVVGVAPLLHTHYMNVGLADGSAQQFAADELQRLNGAQFASITNQSVVFGIP